MSTNILLNAADDYIAFGLSVIALTGKAPNVAVHRRGLYDAFHGLNTQGITEAFSHPETTGIGIICRYPLVVVDIDGEDGAAQWLDINAGNIDAATSDRWVAKTGRGLHLYFADTKPRKPRKLGAKLDLKAEGGYVAAPPSLHPEGHRYEWLAAPSGPLPEVPGNLERLLDELDYEDARRLITKQANTRVRHKQFEDGKWWATWGFDGVIERVRTEPPGNRNAVLYWAACVLTEDDADEEDWMQLNDAALESGLHQREVRTTVRSARKAVGDGIG